MHTNNSRNNTLKSVVLAAIFSFCSIVLSLHFSPPTRAQAQQIDWTNQEKPILDDIHTLRKLSEGNRGRKTKELALKIRPLPAGMNKVRLAYTLASLSTEGDLGKDTVQEVATTL